MRENEETGGEIGERGWNGGGCESEIENGDE